MQSLLQGCEGSENPAGHLPDHGGRLFPSAQQKSTNTSHINSDMLLTALCWSWRQSWLRPDGAQVLTSQISLSIFYHVGKNLLLPSTPHPRRPCQPGTPEAEGKREASARTEMGRETKHCSEALSLPDTCPSHPPAMLSKSHK